MVFHIVIQGYKLFPYCAAIIFCMWLPGAPWEGNKRIVKVH